ncbi:hypothetical protein [Sphingomonas oryzagri]
MAAPIIALLLSIQAPVLVPDAPPVLGKGQVPPGMAYDPITDTVVPIIGWKGTPQSEIGTPPAGTRLRYNRIGKKIGEVPIRR